MSSQPSVSTHLPQALQGLAPKPLSTLTIRFRLVLMLTLSTALFWILETWQPELSALLFVVVFMALYLLFLTAILVIQRQKQKKRLSPKEFANDPDFIWPKFSVIVPAHNEEFVIESTVRNLLALDYPNFDILIVDGNSTDGTPQVLTRLTEALQGHAVPFRWIRRLDTERRGKSAVLNDALEHCSGDWLAVFDADAKVRPDFLKLLLPLALEENAVGAVQARKVIANAGESWLLACQGMEYFFDSYLQGCRDLGKGAVELRGNGQLVKRSVVQALGGWNESSVTDDLDLSTRLHLAGYDIRFASDVPVYEEGVSEFMALVRQRRRWAEGSLTRYLQFAGPILSSTTVGNRVRADMLAYFVHFLFPILLVLDYGLLIVRHQQGLATQNAIILTLSVLPVFAFCFIPALYVALRRFERPQRWMSLVQAVLTGLYMSFLWVPVVFFTFGRMLLKPRKKLTWAKTQHLGQPLA